MKINYIYMKELPNTTANSINVVHQSSAFSNFSEFELFYKNSNSKKIEIFNYYKTPDFKITSYSNILSLFIRIIFMLIKGEYIYTRSYKISLLLGFFSSKIIYECHIVDSSNTFFINFFFPKVIAITNSIKDDLLFLNRKLKIYVFPDCSVEKSFCKVSYGKCEITCGYLGSFYYGKGVDIVVMLASYFPEMLFKIGGGTIHDFQKYYDIPIPSNVIFLGYINYKDIDNFYLDIDFALLPNKSNVYVNYNGQNIGKYTSPLKLFEYMSYGIPFICTDLDVLREVLNQDLALFSKEDSIDDWVSSIKSMKDHNLRRKLGKHSHNYFCENFTWLSRAEKIISCLK